MSLSPELREWLRRLGAAQEAHLDGVAPLDEARARFLATEVSPRRTLKTRYVLAAAAAVKSLVQPGDVVLLKASRSTGLEKVGAALRAAP